MRLSPGTRASLAALLLCGGGPGCAARDSEAEKISQAQEAVKTFFAALPSGDCATLGRMLAFEKPGTDCPQVVDELNRHGMRLVEVLGAQLDGRSSDAVIVRARLELDGKQREKLLRVERHPGGWRLRL